jgi:tripartite-type tricarboxylate transporter receptor subunit TctC
MLKRRLALLMVVAAALSAGTAAAQTYPTRSVTIVVPQAAAGATDVISGTVDVAFAAVPSALQLIKAGKLRAIAVSSAKRNPSLPEVPSIAELG